MRTDVKIGIAVGLFVAVVVVLYFVVTDKNGQTETKQQDERLVGKEPGDSNVLPGDSTPDSGDGSGEDRSLPDDRTAIVQLETSHDGEGRDSTPTGADTTSDAAGGTRTTAADSAGTARATAGAIEIDQGSSRAADQATAERIYVVKRGDSKGFWGIAAEMYGDGKYWYLITRANPGLDTYNLQEGQKVTIPPLPRKTETPGGTRESTPLVTPPGGGKYYIVKETDSQGFSGIARNEYGDGKYAYLITSANPNADSTRLHPGQKLLLPPLPKKTDAARGAQETAPTGTPTGGGRDYIVKETDTQGFWGIAKKEYGDGKYAYLITSANPNVNSSRLRAGQKIILPKLTEAARNLSPAPARRSPAPRRATPAAATADDQPYFPEYAQ